MNRRSFVRNTLVGATALFVPAWVLKAVQPNRFSIQIKRGEEYGTWPIEYLVTIKDFQDNMRYEYWGFNLTEKEIKNILSMDIETVLKHSWENASKYNRYHLKTGERVLLSLASITFSGLTYNV